MLGEDISVESIQTMKTPEEISKEITEKIKTAMGPMVADWRNWAKIQQIILAVIQSAGS
jgi:hypothetical protein